MRILLVLIFFDVVCYIATPFEVVRGNYWYHLPGGGYVAYLSTVVRRCP